MWANAHHPKVNLQICYCRALQNCPNRLIYFNYFHLVGSSGMCPKAHHQQKATHSSSVHLVAEPKLSLHSGGKLFSTSAVVSSISLLLLVQAPAAGHQRRC
jgi:hypothetical protein